MSNYKLKNIREAYKNKILSKKVYQLERKLIPLLKEMEQIGIKLDFSLLRALSKKLNARLRELENRIYKVAGVKFNISSSQQLSEILFKKLGIFAAGLKKTSSGTISTAASELLKIKNKHKIINLVLEYRELAKLKNTYLDTLPKLADPQTHRVHTTYHQLGTMTGRLSSSGPNLQNIPIHGEWGREIRKAFIAENGYKLLSADYSQIELRVVACLAKDKKMLEAFRENQDIHKITAAEVNNLPLIKITPEMRYQAKALNFGVIYGMSVVGFAQAARISNEKAKEFIQEYKKDFSGIAEYVERIKEKARKKGYVETALKRRRYLPQITSSDFRFRQASERMAINMPVQGTAADIMKVAMVRARHKLKKAKTKTRILLQVHDELVLEAKNNEAEKTAEIIRDAMENVLEDPIFKEVKPIFQIPLKVDIKMGDNWGTCQNYPK